MLLNILYNHIYNCVVIWLVNGWKIPIVISNLWLQGWLYMPSGVFCEWLSFATKILIVYFHIYCSVNQYFVTFQSNDESIFSYFKNLLLLTNEFLSINNHILLFIMNLLV
jgi:hypothetical protein